MQLSKSRHNLFAKKDHDKIFIETNYVPPPKSGSGKSKASDLNYNVRKMLATSDLNVKLATKSPVITASSLQKYDDEGIPFDDSRDGASSVTSNHSEKLNAFKEALSKKVSHKLNLSLTAEQLAITDDQGLIINDDDDDLDDIFERHSLVSEQIEHDDNLSDEEEGYDDVGEMKPAEPKFNSTLEVHRSFMKEKQSVDTLRAIQLVESLKILAPPSDINLAEFGSRKMAVVSDSPSQKTDKKTLNAGETASAGSGAVGETEGVSPMTKSFMFLSKLANARNEEAPVMESARHGLKGKAVKQASLPQINKAVVNYVSEMITGDDMSVASSTNKVDYDLPLYEATPLKTVHEKPQGKTMLKLLDKAFAALTFQRKEPVVAPEAKGIPVLKLRSLFDQEELVSAHLTRTEAKDDELFYKALRDHVEKKKVKTKKAEEALKNAPPTANDIVSNIAQFLENKKPPLPLKSALKQSKYDGMSDGGEGGTNFNTPLGSPEKNIYKSVTPAAAAAAAAPSTTANPTPLLDLSKTRQSASGGVLSPIDSLVASTSPSVISESQHTSPVRFPPIGSPSLNNPAGDGRKQLFSSGRYSQAFSPEVQKYVSDTYQNRDPHLKGIATAAGDGKEASDDDDDDDDDDLADLKVARLESQNNSPSETDKYRFQHSTNSYVLKGEVNNSQYGLHSRHPPYPDGWSGTGEGTIQFSERHLKAIEEATAGNAPAVIYIPSTNKHTAEVTAFSTRPMDKKNATTTTGGGAVGGGSAVLFTPNSSMHSMSGFVADSSSRAAVELHAGTTVKSDTYSGVTKHLNYTNSAHSLHSASLPHLKSAAAAGASSYGGFSVASSTHSPRSTSHNKKATRFAVADSSGSLGSTLKQDINEYFDRLKSPGTSVIDESDDDATTVRSAISQREARDQLWYKLHHRYAGDKEGKHSTKLQVGEKLLEGIVEDNQIMHKYDMEMEEGWNV